MKIECTVILLSVYAVNAYFTRPGICPNNVKLQEDFRLANFYNKWYQVYHYASDQRELNNCSTIELTTAKDAIYANISRIDRGLFRRSSMGRIDIPVDITEAARLNITFIDRNAPRRLVRRTYPFWVISMNNYYAAVYTCQYSPLIDKHFMYVWVLSRSKILNDVSLELATHSLKKALGIERELLTKDGISDENCTPKYFDEKPVAPVTFRFPVPI